MNVEDIRVILERTFQMPVAESDAQIVLDRLVELASTEAAQQSVEPTGSNACKVCGFPGGYHDLNLHYPKPATAGNASR